MLLLKNSKRYYWIFGLFNAIKRNFYEFRKYRAGYKYYLSDVKFLENNNIKLIVVIQGIKKQICSFFPEEVLNDDILLSEFSSIDVRTIIYLSRYKYLAKNICKVVIEKQCIKNGETFFIVKDLQSLRLQKISAKNLYQNYELLTKLSKKDMINAISTAIQEQTVLDLKAMG